MGILPAAGSKFATRADAFAKRATQGTSLANARSCRAIATILRNAMLLLILLDRYWMQSAFATLASKATASTAAKTSTSATSTRQFAVLMLFAAIFTVISYASVLADTSTSNQPKHALTSTNAPQARTRATTVKNVSIKKASTSALVDLRTVESCSQTSGSKCDFLASNQNHTIRKF